LNANKDALMDQEEEFQIDVDSMIYKGEAYDNEDASAQISSIQVADPSSSGQNFPEYANLAGLYSEVRLIEFGCQVTPAFAFDEKSSAMTVAIGATTNTTSYTASSPTYSSTLELNNARLYNVARDTSARGTIIKVAPRPRLIFGDVGAPSQTFAAGTGLAAVVLYGENFPVSTPCLNLMIFGVYQFRARQ